MKISELSLGDIVKVNGVRMMYAGPSYDRHAMLKKSGNGYAWENVYETECEDCSQSWDDEPEERLATEEDVGNVVYDEHGDACLLIGVGCGPLKQCVISYGGDTLGWTSKCYVPVNQAQAEAEYAKNNTDEMVGDAPCCRGKQGSCQGVGGGGVDAFNELAKILGVRFVTK